MATKKFALTLLLLGVARCEEQKKRSVFGEHASLEPTGGVLGGSSLHSSPESSASSGWSSYGSLGLGNDLDHGGLSSAGIGGGSGLAQTHSGFEPQAFSSGDLGLGAAFVGLGDAVSNGLEAGAASFGGPNIFEGASSGIPSGIGGGLSSLPTLGLGAAIPLGEHITLVRRIAVPVPHPVPVPIHRDVQVSVPQPVAVPVDRPVLRPVPQPYPVPVIRHVPVPVEQKVAVAVPRPVVVPVYRPVPVPVARPVPVPVVREVPVPVREVPVYKPAPIYEQTHDEWKENW